MANKKLHNKMIKEIIVLRQPKRTLDLHRAQLTPHFTSSPLQWLNGISTQILDLKHPSLLLQSQRPTTTPRNRNLAHNQKHGQNKFHPRQEK